MSPFSKGKLEYFNILILKNLYKSQKIFLEMYSVAGTKPKISKFNSKLYERFSVLLRKAEKS
jgi:hypothetical protein